MTDTDFTRALRHDPTRQPVWRPGIMANLCIINVIYRTAEPRTRLRVHQADRVSTYDEHPMSQAEWLARRDAGAL